jgi:hypothetical protein
MFENKRKNVDLSAEADLSKPGISLLLGET